MYRFAAAFLVLAAVLAGAACTSHGPGHPAAASVVVPACLRSSASASPPGGSLPGAPPGTVTVNFARLTCTVDSRAIGADESTYGGAKGNASGTDLQDTTAQSLLRKLDVGYSRIWLTLAAASDPHSAVVCSATGCDRSLSGDAWVTTMKGMGETPVIGIPDSVSPADAAAIVKHFNVTTANPVRTWLIGNEPDAHGESAATYSKRFNALYDAMKRADSSIVIGGGTTARYNAPFLTTFLADSGSRVDFVDFHFYPGYDSFSQLRAAPKTLTGYLRRLRVLIDRLVPRRATSIGIHVGEWNISFVPPIISRYAYSGFASAWDADTLGRILAAGADSLSFATKNGGLGVVFGDSHRPPAGYAQDTPMPLYEAIGMFTGLGLFPHFGTSLVAAGSGVRGVDAFASAAPDEIVLVNLNSKVKGAMVQVAGARAGGGAGSGSTGRSSGRSLLASVWRIDQTVATPSLPAKVANLTSENGHFGLSLPANSVTTLVITR